MWSVIVRHEDTHHDWTCVNVYGLALIFDKKSNGFVCRNWCGFLVDEFCLSWIIYWVDKVRINLLMLLIDDPVAIWFWIGLTKNLRDYFWDINLGCRPIFPDWFFLETDKLMVVINDQKMIRVNFSFDLDWFLIHLVPSMMAVKVLILFKVV